MSPAPAQAADSTPRATPASRPRHGAASCFLAAAILVWIGSVVHAGFAIRELSDLRRRNEERAIRIRSLDPEFRALVTRDLAIGRLLDAGVSGDVPQPLGAPVVATRPLAADIGGHTLREITATWEGVSSEELSHALLEAESSSPLLRLRRIELSPRPGATVRATAVFETL